jgi:chemotaxis family two-component system sensor kinase Cph1
MTQERDTRNTIHNLRRRAESALTQKTRGASDISALSPEDLQKLVYELQIHQIELEMQNEELLQAQIKLEELKDRYLDLYDFAPVGYVTLSDRGIILEANLTAVRLLGIERELLIKRPFSRLICKADADTFHLHVNRVFESGDEQTCEVKLVKRDGTLFHAQLASNPVKDLGGLRTRCHTVLTNITDIKLAEAGLREKTDALERSNKDLEQFAYVAAHDLREPLVGAAAYLKLLERRSAKLLDKEARKCLSKSFEIVQRMDWLIQGLLAYSRVSDKQQKFEPTDCNSCLSDALANLRSAIDEGGARITTDHLPTVMAIPVHITQLFQNLVGNAIKYRGNVPLQIHLGAESANSEYQFWVRDNGMGIEPPNFERIFQIFQRVDNSSSPIGTGIGLATCKKIVERHGGRIWVESEPGKGSTFRFTFPAIRRTEFEPCAPLD